MKLSAHETDHLRALVQSQNFDGVVEFMAAKVDGTTLPGVGTDAPPDEITIAPAKSAKTTKAKIEEE